MMRQKAILSLLCCALALSGSAAPVSAAFARKAAGRWMTHRPSAHMGARMNRTVRNVRTVRADGDEVFHVVDLDKGGFVVLSADDRIDPVIAFSDSGSLVESEENPLWVLLNLDLPQRLKAHKDGRAAQRDPSSPLMRGRGRRRWRTPSEDWTDLLSDGETVENAKDATRQTSVSDVRVDALLKSKWSQSTAGGGKCYNTYTPNGYVCGCVATAGAQVMRYHRYPTAAMPAVTRSCWVDDTVSERTTIGGIYDWDAMPLVPASTSLSTANREAIGKLCYDAGVATRMNWASDGSGACDAEMATGLVNVFGYASAKCELRSGMPTESIQNAIYANLDAKCPVLLGIHRSGGGHEIVADGYGVENGTIYTHLNLGWSGSDNAWYALPTVATTSYTYDTLSSVVYNIFPTETGELITGRILDRDGIAVANANVTATNGETVRTAVSDEHGVYALHVAGGKTWSVRAVTAYADSVPVDITVRNSKSSGYTVKATSYTYSFNGVVGNSWGNDIMLLDYSVPRLESLVIEGPSILRSGTSASYVCRALRTDGTLAAVAATWNLSDNTSGLIFKRTYATMDAPGVLVAERAGRTVKLEVSFSEYGISRSATFGVKIVDYDPYVAVPSAVQGLVYDGSSQRGVPAGTGYTLSGDTTAVNVGRYVAVATLKSDYFWTDNTTAPKEIPWEIARADCKLDGVTLADATFDYDGEPHALAISGTLPPGITVSYEGNGRTHPGTYAVTAHFADEGANYISVPDDLTATLTITGETGYALQDVTVWTTGATTGCKVTGPKKLAANGVAKLKAKAPKGTVFAGWYVNGEPLDLEGFDWRNPSLPLAVPSSGFACEARFVPLKEDHCGTISVPLDENGFLIPGPIAVDSVSLPTVTVKGLPKGLSFNRKTCTIEADEKKLAKLKAGSSAVTVSVKNAGGYRNAVVVEYDRGEPGVDFIKPDPWPFGAPHAIGRVVDLDLGTGIAVKGLPKGLKFSRKTGILSGVPTKAGRWKTKCDGVAYYLTVQGSPSHYIEVVSETAGCKVTGGGVVAAGAKFKTRAKAAKGMRFADWFDAEGGLIGEKATATWLCGEIWDDESGCFVPTVPDLIIGSFISKDP